jgi:hypothetical protein
VYVYSDREYTGSNAFDEVLVLPELYAMPKMVSNLSAQVHFCLWKGATEDTTAFLDADVLAVTPAPVDPWGEKGPAWDLLVTKRDHVAVDADGNKLVGVAQPMPYNYGVLLHSGTVAATEGLIWLRDRIAKMGPALQDWYGNQWALRELVGGSFTDPVRLAQRQHRYGPIKIQVEDCAYWNYSPEAPNENLELKYFLHCKGRRKELFEHYAEELT